MLYFYSLQSFFFCLSLQTVLIIYSGSQYQKTNSSTCCISILSNLSSSVFLFKLFLQFSVYLQKTILTWSHLWRSMAFNWLYFYPINTILTLASTWNHENYTPYLKDDNEMNSLLSFTRNKINLCRGNGIE